MKLRALEPEDLSALYEIENDVDVWACSATSAPISQYALRQYIANCKNDIFEDGQLRLAMDVEGHLVGLLDLTHFSPIHRRAEVGIVVRKEYRRAGNAAEALRLLDDYAHRVVGLHQLYAIVSRANEPALKLFASCGYQETGNLKDWLFSASGEVQDACIFQSFIAN